MRIDLTILPGGERYEDRYGAWLDIFKSICETPIDGRITVRGAPMCWVPLLKYLNCEIETPRYHMAEDMMLGSTIQYAPYHIFSEAMWESFCTFRPETVDAFWKIGMEWEDKRSKRYQPLGEQVFVVTNSNAFYRQEVMTFLDTLHHFTPEKRKVVLVPCAADKPYPAKLHQAVLDMLPDDYYLANITGVLGIVPQDLWEVMPHYDSGIPNRWRVLEEVRDYFTIHHHQHIVVYSDFYNEAVHMGLTAARQNTDRLINAVFPFGSTHRIGYIDLLADENLTILDKVIRNG